MFRIALFAFGFALLTFSAPAHAQNPRTWVSGVGDDSSAGCSRSAPCATFSTAIARTADGGEINCVDNGSFALFTIAKSITIDCSENQAAIGASGGTGVTVSGPGIIVTLRGLRIQGYGNGIVGINIVAAAAVHIQNSRILGFRAGAATGIRVSTTSGNPKVMVSDTVVQDNGVLDTSTGGGIISVGTGGFPFVTLDNVKVNNNAQGVANGTNGRMRITNSLFSGNFAGVGADPGAQVSLNNSDINFSQMAVAGTVTSFGNNRLIGNTSDGAPLVAASTR